MLDLSLTLSYLAEVIGMGAPYQYSGSLTANTQTQYNALSWTDVRPKPSWQTILDNADAAWNYYFPPAPPTYTPEQVYVLINTLQSTATGLQTAVAGKSDNPHSHPMIDVTDLGTALTGKADVNHNHTASQVTDFSATARSLISGTSGISYSSSTGVIAPSYGTGINTICQGSDGRLSDARTPLAHSHVISDVTGLQTALDGKAALSHAHSISDVTNLATELSRRPTVYQGATLKTSAKMVCKSVSTTGGTGTAIFYLTSDGTASGAALFTNIYDEAIDFEVNDSANLYRPSWTISGDKKTLTATVTRSSPTGVIALLGLNILSAPSPTPNGTVVRLTVWGD